MLKDEHDSLLWSWEYRTMLKWKERSDVGFDGEVAVR